MDRPRHERRLRARRVYLHRACTSRLLPARYTERSSHPQVYKSVPALQRPPPGAATASSSSEPTHSSLSSLASRILPISSLPFYFRHPAFLPSFSLALLYLTVLSFSGQMVTFLLSIGYTPLHVGLARTGSTVVELSATWVSPWLMRRIGPVRGGIWSLSCQMIFLAAGLSWFLAEFEGEPARRLASATGLAVCVAFSRLGLWGYDLCAQAIVQDVSLLSLLRSRAVWNERALTSYRRWKQSSAARFRPSRPRSRTSLSCCRLPRRLPFHGRTSSAGPSSSARRPCTLRAACTRALCGYVAGTSSTLRRASGARQSGRRTISSTKTSLDGLRKA